MASGRCQNFNDQSRRPRPRLGGMDIPGFMLPTRIHNHLVTEFMLMRTQSTCRFGIPPELHEVVEVLKVAAPPPRS